MRQEDEEEWRRVKRALWIAALVVAGVVAAVLFLRTWLAPELPEIDEAAFIEPDVERPQDADNAYLAFVAATNDIAFTYVAADAVPREEWDAVLASNAQAIAKIDAAMRLPAWYNAASRHGEPSIFAVHFGNVRSLFTVRIKREVEMGEIAAVVEHVHDMASMTRIMMEGASDTVESLHMLTATAVYTAVCEVVLSGKATDDQLSQILQLLMSLDDRKKALSCRRRILANDYRYHFSDTMRRVEKGEYDMSEVMSHMGEWFPRKGFAFSPARTRVECADVYLRAAALLERDFDKDDWQELKDEFENELHRRLWVQWFVPNCGAWAVKVEKIDDLRQWAEQMSRFDWIRRMQEVIVAAELYRRRAGRYPAALEDLVPEFLPSVPVDPFDHGAPVKYDAQRGVIWTVGPDRKCDGELVKFWRSTGCLFDITGKAPSE